MLTFKMEEPIAQAVVNAIRAGDVEALDHLLADQPGLATSRLESQCHAGVEARTLLHIATDWPGNFPNGAEIVKRLIDAGADVNARFAGTHGETPLHWAASCDDVDVLDALLDHGADIEADGAVIGGGTPLADATAFGQWKAARRLIERGAKANLWQAAALGLLDRVERFFKDGAVPTSDDVTQAFWCACHGGQRQTAEFLLQQGAELNWIGYDQLTPFDAATRSEAHDLAEWLVASGAKSAAEIQTQNHK